LIDLTGREIRADKAGSLDISLASILQRINLISEQWLEVITGFEKHFTTAIASETLLVDYCEHTELLRRPNLSACRHFFT